MLSFLLASSLARAADPVTDPVTDPAADGVQAAALDRAHLERLGVWAGTSAVGGGLMLGLARQKPGLQAYGLQTLGWSAVNGAIVGLAWKGTAEPRSLAQIHSAREVYALNVGLDAGYVGTGLALALLSKKAGWGQLEGHGWAAVTQGAGLLVLDLVVLSVYPKG